MYQLFNNKNLAIITTMEMMESYEWRMYVEKHWDKIIKMNSRMMVMGGIHGYKDGRLGDVDKGLLEENKGQVKILKQNKAKEIKDNNIDIVLEDVGQHMNNSELDAEKMIKAVKIHKPTIIILAFCWTNNSDLNPILRASGIYSVLLLLSLIHI